MSIFISKIEKSVRSQLAGIDTSTFLFLAVLGSFGRLFIVSRSVCVSKMLLSKLGSMYGAISLAVPQRALPYSSPLRYFLAFLLLQYTISRRAAAPATPISRSKGWMLGAALAKAAEQPSMKCSSFSDKSTPAASRYACPSFPNR